MANLRSFICNTEFGAILTYLSIVIGYCAIGVLSSTGDDRGHVRTEIFADYDKSVIPDNVTVKVGLSLIRFEARPELHRLDVFAWMRFVWNDKRLMWNESEIHVSVLRVPVDDVWTPDIVLYNSYDLDIPCSPANALIYPNGEVLWVPKCTFQANCDMENLRNYPNGRQSCFLKFGSWTFDGFMLDLAHYNNESNIDMADLWDTSDWRITSNNATKYEMTYPCCIEPYPSIKFHIEFERKKERKIRNSSPRVKSFIILTFTSIFMSILKIY